MQNFPNRPLDLTMQEDRKSVRRRVDAHRARKLAAGMVVVTAYLPAEIAELIDKIKAERGAPSRAPVIEEAMRFYIENMRA